MNIDNRQFSAREKEVIELLMQGKSNKEIALALSISARTVEFHLKNVYDKLQVKSRAEAILKLGKTTAGNELGESTVAEMVANEENGENTISAKRIQMKQKMYVTGGLLLVVILAAASLYARQDRNNTPIPIGSTMEVSETAVPLMSSIGTSFVFLPGLGDGTESEVIPQTDGTGISIWPTHIEITLTGYPLEGTLMKPKISVFPAKKFAQMDPSCAKANIDGLAYILKTGQVSLAEPLPCVSVPDTLPFVPQSHAAQVFHAQEKILGFKNGGGVRYITDYSQAHYPDIINNEIFYTFQGLSSDGNWYVSVVLPINLASLDDVQNPENDDEYPGYVTTMKDLINRPDNAFTPSLESLDAMIQSMRIGIEERALWTPSP